MFSQEEPRNCGAWSFVRPRLDYALGARTAYAGRPEMPTRNFTIKLLVISLEQNFDSTQKRHWQRCATQTANC